MAIFQRAPRKAADPRPAISRFWTWWGEHRDDVVAAVVEHRAEDAARLLRPAVAALDPALESEASARPDGGVVVIVSGGGKPELRAIAERWAMAAPADPEVEFWPVRRADPQVFDSVVLNVDDFDVDMRELVAGTRVDPHTGAIDVVVHHPIFPLLDNDSRLEVAFRGLNAALGEDGVERWLGTVDVSADVPLDAIALAMLGDVAEQLRPAPGGQWATLQGSAGGRPVTAVVRRPLDRVERPLADTYLAVVLPYRAKPNGMPRSGKVTGDAEKLQAQVLAALGGDGPHAIHIGYVTGGGQVVGHFYVDGLEVDPSTVEPALAGWPHGACRVQVALDPSWETVAPLLR